MKFILFRDTIYRTDHIITVARGVVDKDNVEKEYRHFSHQIEILVDDAEDHETIVEYFDNVQQLDSAFTLLWEMLQRSD